MKRRFIDRFGDTLRPMYYQFFMQAGGATRTYARRSLRNAAQVPLAELSDFEREVYQAKKRAWAAKLNRWVLQYGTKTYGGPISSKPKRRQKISQPGRPPLLHPKAGGKSQLKSLLYFALSPSQDYVVIGPESIGRNKRIVRQGELSSIEELEKHRPFMEPAYAYVEPRLPQYLASASRKLKG
jgi:hypothetical protein